MDGIQLEGNGIGDLAWHGVQVHHDPELLERGHRLGIEFGHRHGPQHDLPRVTIARRHPQHMVDKVKINLKAACTVENRRGRQTTRGDVERDVPGVIPPRRQGEANLTDHLRPQVQRIARVLPNRIWQFGPALRARYRHRSLPPSVLLDSIMDRDMFRRETPMSGYGRAYSLLISAFPNSATHVFADCASIEPR